MKFKYQCKQAYKTDKLLIEFVQIGDADTLVDSIIDAFRQINLIVKLSEQNWFNDEYVYQVNSTIGNFYISRKTFDLVVMYTDEGNAVIEKLCAELNKDSRFEFILPTINL
jgi:hypothetical protein